jgi:E3 ubiquitin-protein ligase RNF216
VEEAISEAVIRKCPKCKKPIIKSDGCNKIRCACGAFMCYVCQKAIKDYSHFCQTAHCTHPPKSCKKCPLYTKAEEDDARAMREAGYAAAEKVKMENEANRQGQKNPADVDVDVDVESILRAK